MMVRAASLLSLFLASSTFASGYSTPSLIHSKISSSLRSTAEASNSLPNGVTGDHGLLTNFLVDMKGVGAVRFVVVGTGAILETIGSFDNLRFADTVKGRLATLSTDNPCFECHIRLGEVQEVKNVIVEKFEKKLRITRFLGLDGATLLSAILQPEDRQESIDNWDALRNKYGESFKLP